MHELQQHEHESGHLAFFRSQQGQQWREPYGERDGRWLCHLRRHQVRDLQSLGGLTT